MVTRRICDECETYPCRCRCPQCKKRLPESTTRRFRYCSPRCRDAAYRKREASKNTAAVTQSLTNEWYTPAEYIKSARWVLGGIDLDPASCEDANQVVQAARFYSEADPGLGHEWKGRVWLNPPYGRLAGEFVINLAREYDAGHVTAAVTLVNAHCTDTTWFRPLWDHTLCFTYGRLNFGAGTAARSGSTHGSVFAYLGPDQDAFAAEFAQYGAIVRRFR